MALAKSKYRLTRGTHSMPNPNYNWEKPDGSVPSHVEAQTGDVVELTADQFKSFRDRFAPIEVASTDVRDADAKSLADAKTAAAVTGQAQNPNKLLDSKVKQVIDAIDAAKNK